MKYLALVAACLLTITLAGPATSAPTDDTPTPTVIWSELTSFNPDVRPYEFTFSGEGDYPYRIFGSEGVMDVPAPGTYVYHLSSGWSGLIGRLSVLKCDESTCGPLLAQSPVLEVVGALTPSIDRSDYIDPVSTSGGTRSFGYSIRPVLDETTLRWFLTRRGGGYDDAVASGDIPDPVADGTATIELPAGLAPGVYGLYLRQEVTADRYGHLVGNSEDPLLVVVDGTGPKLRMTLDTDTIYPREDLSWAGLRSALEFELFASEETTGTVTFTGPTGVVGRRMRVVVNEYGTFHTWSGKSGRTVYPEGRYEIRLDAADAAGNPATVAKTFYLSHATDHPVVTTKVVPAVKTVVDKAVGACSSLTVPSSHGWAGSLGYASLSRCGRASAGNIATLHRLYLPDSLMNDYRVKIWFFGAASKSRPESAIASGFVNRRGEIATVNVARGPRGRWNALPREDMAPFLRKDERGRRYVLWELGTSGGHRYDVKSFRYRIRSVELR